MTAVTKLASVNCSADTLTATRTVSGQRLASAHAVRNTHSPMGPINRASSATGTKRAGDTLPSSGLFQRSSASNPSMTPLSALTTG